MAQDSEFEAASGAHQAMALMPVVITDARQDAGMSQRALARKTGLDRTYISRLENGHTEPTIKSLMRLAEGLGVAASTLMARAEACSRAAHKRRTELARAINGCSGGNTLA